MKERIQKLLARAGYGSRREIERWIVAGEISVNGQPASLGQQIDADDKVQLRGKTLHLNSRLRGTPKVLAYHKKAGEMCTRHDPEGRPTVFENLPRLKQGRWVMIGRLDINTDGLLLFTTDGELANKLMHPSMEIEREYAVRVLGEVDGEMLRRLQTGVQLEEATAHFKHIQDAGGEGANHWYHVILTEGRNREVRRLWESQGVKVSRLIRVRYGNITLPRYLRGGYCEELDVKEKRQLYASVGMTFEDGSVEKLPKRSGARTGLKSDRRKAVERPANNKPAPAARKNNKPNPYAGAHKTMAKKGPRQSSGKKRR